MARPTDPSQAARADTPQRPPPGLRIARLLYLAVAALTALDGCVLGARGRLDLAWTLLFALLLAYPIGFAWGVLRLRPTWREQRLGWPQALPFLVHGLTGLWGALGLASRVLRGTAHGGLGSALELGLLPALVAMALGWLLVLALGRRVAGIERLLGVAVLVPLGLLHWCVLFIDELALSP